MDKPNKLSYKDSGVNKEEGYRAVDLMKQKVKKTLNSHVLSDLGSFGSFYALGQYKEPILVSGTDGVGTKLKIAFQTQIYNTIGQDCVAMCVNDILCHGAKPLFFLDYLACGELDADVAAEIVGGIADGCQEAGAALIGGETAEMPGFYQKGEYDVAGFVVGVVEKDNLINGSSVTPGDVLLALPSSGIHSNGFSLVRKLVPNVYEEVNGQPIYIDLLRPTKIYVQPVLEALSQFSIHGMAHITGGGLIENVPRALNKNVDAIIDTNNVQVLPIFKYLLEVGADPSDVWGTFNMGVGFVLILPENEEQNAISFFKEKGINAYKLGDVVPGSGQIKLENQ